MNPNMMTVFRGVGSASVPLDSDDPDATGTLQSGVVGLDPSGEQCDEEAVDHLDHFCAFFLLGRERAFGFFGLRDLGWIADRGPLWVNWRQAFRQATEQNMEEKPTPTLRSPSRDLRQWKHE